MAQLPIKGQEVLLSIVSPDGLEDALDHIKDNKFTLDLEIITEQYLGQTADQFDEIFRGVTVELTLDMASPKVIDFATKVVNRAQRRTAAAQTFQIITALRFPSGERRRMLFPDLKFGAFPFDFAGRDKYSEVKITGKGSTYRKL